MLYPSRIFILRKAIKVDLNNVSSFLQNAIKDIQFAPNFGQSYHLIAVASNDIELFTIKPVKWIFIWLHFSEY